MKNKEMKKNKDGNRGLVEDARDRRLLTSLASCPTEVLGVTTRATTAAEAGSDGERSIPIELRQCCEASICTRGYAWLQDHGLSAKNESKLPRNQLDKKYI